MRHARLRRLSVPPPSGGRRRLQLCPVDLRPPPYARQPERQLMAAVLVDAVATWRRHRRPHNDRARRRLAEVVAWFDDADSSWPFSFERICGVLELDAARIRRMLLPAGSGARPAMGTHQQPCGLTLRRVLS